MQKFLSLLMAALLCLCAVMPAMAEEAPALQIPATTEGYQQAYEALLADVIPTAKVTWTTVPMEGGECVMAMIDNSFVSVMLLSVDGQATEIAVLLQSGLDQDSLMTFLSLAGYAGAALLRSDAVTSTAACDAFLGNLLNAFELMTQGEQPTDIYGLPGAISITPMEDGSYQYYFVLKLTDAE